MLKSNRKNQNRQLVYVRAKTNFQLNYISATGFSKKKHFSWRCFLVSTRFKLKPNSIYLLIEKHNKYKNL